MSLSSRSGIQRHRRTFSVFLLANIFATSIVRAEPLILYPTLASPYDQIPSVIVEGVRQVYPAADEINVEKQDELPLHSIVLTRSVFNKFAGETNTIGQSVLGLVELQTDTEIYSLDMRVDPSVMVKETLRLQPEIDHFVFFDFDSRTEKMVEEVSFAYEDRVATSYHNASSSVNALRAVAAAFKKSGESTAFVFLPGFIEIDSTLLLDAIVDGAWDRQIVTVGTRAGYVRAGLMLGVLPDFVGYGTQLAKLLRTAVKEKFVNPIQPMLQATKTAVNTRTASNSGITIAPESLEWDFSYPEK